MPAKKLMQFNGHINLGDEYHGNDEGETLDMKIGRPMLVSEKKCEQLICDFGHAFSYVRQDEASMPSSAKIVEQKSADDKQAKTGKQPRLTVLRRGKKAKTPRRSARRSRKKE